MAKPRAKITRSTTPKPDYIFFIEPEIEIAAWCPDPAAQEPPEQVHLILHLPDAQAGFCRWPAAKRRLIQGLGPNRVWFRVLMRG